MTVMTMMPGRKAIGKKWAGFQDSDFHVILQCSACQRVNFVTSAKTFLLMFSLAPALLDLPNTARVHQAMLC